MRRVKFASDDDSDDEVNLISFTRYNINSKIHKPTPTPTVPVSDPPKPTITIVETPTVITTPSTPESPATTESTTPRYSFQFNSDLIQKPPNTISTN